MGAPSEETGMTWAKTPRWVRITGTVAAVVAVVLIAMVIFGGGHHGPGRHLHHSDGQAPPAGFVGAMAPGPDRPADLRTPAATSGGR
jgi:hypothetical protein